MKLKPKMLVLVLELLPTTKPLVLDLAVEPFVNAIPQ